MNKEDEFKKIQEIIEAIEDCLEKYDFPTGLCVAACCSLCVRQLKSLVSLHDFDEVLQKMRQAFLEEK